MKTNVLILLVCGALLFGNQKAGARIVTLLLTGTNQTATLVLQENESAKLARGYDAYAQEVGGVPEAGLLQVSKQGARFAFVAGYYDWRFNGSAFSIAGPATITLNSGVTNRTETQAAFVSFEVSSEKHANGNGGGASGNGAVTIELESSTNLVNWSSAATAVLTNVGPATFFRVKAEKATPANQAN